MTTATNESSDNSLLPQFKILTLQFNQICTALSMGTMSGYKLFSIQPDCKLEENYDRQFKHVRIIERLYMSSLIAIVSDDEPRKMRLFHFQIEREICQKLFPSSILSIKLNRERLVVCLEDSLYIFDIHKMELIQRLCEIATNQEGLFALSTCDEQPYLAYPASSTKGGVQIANIETKMPKILIPAHDGPLAAMAFDGTGTKLATASTKGTVIRVHSVLDGTCLSELRRGLYREATIYSLAFSPDSAFLASSSNTGTIHIFRLVHLPDEMTSDTNTWTNTVTNTVGYVGSYFSKQVGDVLAQDRAFATVHLQSTTVRTTIAMNEIKKRLFLFVAAYDGTVMVYEVNKTVSGECNQIHQQVVFNLSDKSSNDPTTDAQSPNQLQTERKSSSSSPPVKS